MMKPRKTWSVGNKTFETYAEALREAGKHRRTRLFNEVFDVIYDTFDDQKMRDELRNDIGCIVENLLEVFNITRKKGASLGKESETASQK